MITFQVEKRYFDDAMYDKFLISDWHHMKGVPLCQWSFHTHVVGTRSMSVSLQHK